MHYLSVAGFVGGLALGILTVPYAIKYTAMKDIEKPIYVACVTNGENKTQRDVAEAADVTEVTIRNRYKGLKQALDL